MSSKQSAYDVWIAQLDHQIHYRSYGDGFLQVKWPNQQCESTEGRDDDDDDDDDDVSVKCMWMFPCVKINDDDDDDVQIVTDIVVKTGHLPLQSELRSFHLC